MTTTEAKQAEWEAQKARFLESGVVETKYLSAIDEIWTVCATCGTPYEVASCVWGSNPIHGTVKE